MPLLFVTTREGETMRLKTQTDPDLAVMDAIRDGGIDEIMALCGGTCACATCHVYVEGAFLARLPPIGEDENALLDGSGRRRPESRLSCQLPLASVPEGLRVTIAPEE